MKKLLFFHLVCLFFASTVYATSRITVTKDVEGGVMSHVTAWQTEAGTTPVAIEGGKIKFRGDSLAIPDSSKTPYIYEGGEIIFRADKIALPDSGKTPYQKTGSNVIFRPDFLITDSGNTIWRLSESFESDVTSIGTASETFLVVDSQALTGTSDAVPQNVHVKVMRGGGFTSASGTTLNFHGTFEAPLMAVFGTGVSPTWTNNPVIYARWFGTSNAAMQKMARIINYPATIVFTHDNSSGTTTGYVASASVTFDDDVNFRLEPGAQITPDTGITVTVSGTVTAGPYQIFGGAGTVDLTGSGIRYGKWWAGGNDTFEPNTSNAVDLGSSSRKFKDAYVDGTGNIDTLQLESGTAVNDIKDEDNMISNSATALATQQSIKAYMDTNSPLPRSYLAGLGMSNAVDTSHDIAIAVGKARNSTDAHNIQFTSGLTKQIDANWAAGDEAGGFPSGVTLGSGTTTYHVFVIYNSTSGVTDAGFDSSLTASNLLTDATGYTAYRRIGSVIITSGNTIYQFIQNGDEFYFKNTFLDQSNNVITSTSKLLGLSTPKGITTKAIFNFHISSTSTRRTIYFSSPSVTDQLPATTTAPAGQWTTPNPTANDISAGGSHGMVWTNTSGQIRARASNNMSLYLTTIGWIDRRGRDD